MAAALFAAAAGAGSTHYFVATNINRSPRSLAQRLGEEGITRIKGHFRGILLNARTHGRY